MGQQLPNRETDRTLITLLITDITYLLFTLSLALS